VANSGESQQQCLQGFAQSLQRNQAWSGRRESNSRSQLAVAVGGLHTNKVPRLGKCENLATVAGQCERRRLRRRGTCPTVNRMEHNPYTCQGCDQVLDLDDLANWLHTSSHTLYKWASVGYPTFPRRLRLANKRIAVTCNSVKHWLSECAS
jgi:predicted DNA-binding transcriptional regulator AlpA